MQNWSIMNAAFSEILNSQLKSLAKNKQTTYGLLVQTIDYALGEIVVDFEDDEEEGEDVSADMIILQKCVELLLP